LLPWLSGVRDGLPGWSQLRRTLRACARRGRSQRRIAFAPSEFNPRPRGSLAVWQCEPPPGSGPAALSVSAVRVAEPGPAKWVVKDLTAALARAGRDNAADSTRVFF